MRFITLLLISIFITNANASIFGSVLEAITEFTWFKKEMPHHTPATHPLPDTHPFPKTLPTPLVFDDAARQISIQERNVVSALAHSLREHVDNSTLEEHQIHSILIQELPVLMKYCEREHGGSENHSRYQYLYRAKQTLMRIIAEAKGKYASDRELLLELLHKLVPDLDAYRGKLINEQNKILMKITGFDEIFHVRVIVKDVHPANVKICYWQDMKLIIRKSLTATRYPEQLENEVYGWVTEEKMRGALENAAKQIRGGARKYFAESLGKGYGLLNDFYTRVEIEKERVKVTVDAPCGKEGQFIFKNETAPALEDEDGPIIMTPYINVILLE